MADRIPVESVVFRTDLYPRIDQSPETVSRYAEDLEPLPPIEINQNNILIDGWHRWTAHKQAGVADLLATVTETTSEAEVFRLAVERNAKHGLQLSAADKRKYVKDVWLAADRPDGVLEAEIARTVAMSISARSKGTRAEQKGCEGGAASAHGASVAGGLHAGRGRRAGRRAAGEFCRFMQVTKTAKLSIWTASPNRSAGR